VWLVGSQITADGGIALAVDINSQLGVLASEFSGPLYIARDSLIQLQGGSTQVANPYGNDVRVGVGSTLYTLGNASAPNTLIGPLYIYDFGKAVLSGTTVNGKLKCSSGGDAVDDGAVTVTGSISGCEHFPAP
jgi:hypothetical protein